jgi:hypothetical protein
MASRPEWLTALVQRKCAVLADIGAVLRRAVEANGIHLLPALYAMVQQVGDIGYCMLMHARLADADMTREQRHVARVDACDAFREATAALLMVCRYNQSAWRNARRLAP